VSGIRHADTLGDDATAPDAVIPCPAFSQHRISARPLNALAMLATEPTPHPCRWGSATDRILDAMYGTTRLERLAIIGIAHRTTGRFPIQPERIRVRFPLAAQLLFGLVPGFGAKS